MGSGKFGFNMKKDKVIETSDTVKTDSVKDKFHKLQKKLKKTEKKKTETVKEKKIWWNQCSSCK